MLFLFETAAGYALFKVVKENKLEKADVSFVVCAKGIEPVIALSSDLKTCIWLICMVQAQREGRRTLLGDGNRSRVSDSGRPRSSFSSLSQDLYKDFETLDNAQKVRAWFLLSR